MIRKRKEREWVNGGEGGCLRPAVVSIDCSALDQLLDSAIDGRGHARCKRDVLSHIGSPASLRWR